MELIIDTHVHFYSVYGVGRALAYLIANLGNLKSGARRVALLAERAGSDFYEDLRTGRVDILPNKMAITGIEGLITVESTTNEAVDIYRGRQFVSSEGLEILSLLSCDTEMEGAPSADIIKSTLDVGGVPVLGWAPGKWLFKRRHAVEEILSSARPGTLLVGDTTLRPYGCPEPSLMRQARKNGTGVIAGSDPLPFEGEEIFMGTYGTLVNADCSEPPVGRAALRDMLLGAAPQQLERVGMRSDLFTAAVRALKCKFGAKD